MYLVDIPSQARETEAILRLLDTDPLMQPLFYGVGLIWPFCWCVVQIAQERLIRKRLGDVDILAGNLTWTDPERFDTYVRKEHDMRPEWHPSYHFDFAARRLADEGGLVWPPRVDYLVAIEVKCAYFTDTIHAAKGGKTRTIQKQIEGLQKMAFDRVVLLDIIANNPASGEGMGAWSAASWHAHDSLKEMRPVLDGRIVSGTAVDHFALSIGAVTGGEENLRGAGLPQLLHRGTSNSQRENSTQASNREEMNRNIQSLLAGLSAPYSYPHVFIDCGTCKTIHLLGSCKKDRSPQEV